MRTPHPAGSLGSILSHQRQQVVALDELTDERCTRIPPCGSEKLRRPSTKFGSHLRGRSEPSSRSRIRLQQVMDRQPKSILREPPRDLVRDALTKLMGSLIGQPNGEGGQHFSLGRHSRSIVAYGEDDRPGS
jgi:hypothetical protein